MDQSFHKVYSSFSESGAQEVLKFRLQTSDSLVVARCMSVSLCSAGKLQVLALVFMCASSWQRFSPLASFSRMMLPVTPHKLFRNGLRNKVLTRPASSPDRHRYLSSQDNSTVM